MINFFFACTLPNPHFFFLPPWWEYLGNGSVDALGQCQPVFIFPDDTVLVGLAVLDMLLRIAGFAAVVALIISGVEHLFSGGNAEKAAQARSRIWNSIIGLAIAMTAAAIVTFVGKELVK